MKKTLIILSFLILLLLLSFNLISCGSILDSIDDNSGTYLVGTDLDAGTYILIPSGSGYFKISTDSSGSLSSIIANDNFSGRNMVSLVDGEYFELTRASMYTRENAPEITLDNGYYPEGMYEVGVDIVEGEYKLESVGTSAYLKVTNSCRHTLSSIVTNDNFTTNKYQSVSNGQFIYIRGAKMKINI